MQLSLASDPDAAVNENTAAEFLGVSVRTLEAWRVRGGGPPYVKIGRAVRYQRRALVSYQQEHTVSSTTDADAKEWADDHGSNRGRRDFLMNPHCRIAFARIAADALSHADVLVRRWLPDGRREGPEWVAINPTRADHCRGSFKVNLATGIWSDFATGDKGGDLIALAAYLFHPDQAEAARNIAAALGLDPHE
jgi:hypothetical protein